MRIAYVKTVNGDILHGESRQTLLFRQPHRTLSLGAFSAPSFSAFGTPALFGALADPTVFVVTTVAAGAAFFRLSAQSCQKSTIGLATNTDEYVPMMIPITSAKENP